jgi:hypothetical protein
VVWLGLPDPCLTRAKLAANADSVVDTLRRLLNAWTAFDLRSEGFVLSKLLELLYPEHAGLGLDEGALALRSSLEEITECAAGRRPEPRALAARLKSFRHRVVDDLFLEMDDSRRRSGSRWLVRKVADHHP